MDTSFIAVLLIFVWAVTFIIVAVAGLTSLLGSFPSLLILIPAVVAFWYQCQYFPGWINKMSPPKDKPVAAVIHHYTVGATNV